jgi:hypothetical protein
VHESKKTRFFELLSEINQYLKEGIPIPIGTMKFFMGFLMSKRDFDLMSILEKSYKSSEEIKELLSNTHFGKMMKEKFEIEGQFIKPFRLIPIDSISKKLMHDYFLEDSLNGFKSKGEVTRFFYSKLRDEITPILNEDERNDFSKYHKSIISAILTIGVGFSWPKNKELNMHNLYLSSRRTLKKII